uniref:Ig-like domain-containing protein n=1 Tax=Branchiostoma floridae TaxID=7739 RepID=C3ZSI7_BRAFL|eukprot:XP_002588378.1 hypothetical protein BRAFLDRAFT_63328 [Branchiostoma floridae]
MTFWFPIFSLANCKDNHNVDGTLASLVMQHFAAKFYEAGWSLMRDDIRDGSYGTISSRYTRPTSFVFFSMKSGWSLMCDDIGDDGTIEYFPGPWNGRVDLVNGKDLRIPSVSRDDDSDRASVKYRCSQPTGGVGGSHTLHVRYPPSSITVTGYNSSSALHPRDELQLSCTASDSKPEPSFAWHRNGPKIEDGNTLTINPIKLENNGDIITMRGAGKRKTRPPVRFGDYQLDDQYAWSDHASLRDCPSPVVSSLSPPIDELEDEIDHQLAEVSRSIERIQLNEARLREHDQQTKPKKTQRNPPPQTRDIRQDDVPRNSRVRMTSPPRAFSREPDSRTFSRDFGQDGRGAPRKNPSRRPAHTDEYEHTRGYPSLRDIRSMNYLQDPFTSAERVRAQPRQPPPGDTFGWDLDGDNNRRPRRQRDYSSAVTFSPQSEFDNDSTITLGSQSDLSSRTGPVLGHTTLTETHGQEPVTLVMNPPQSGEATECSKASLATSQDRPHSASSVGSLTQHTSNATAESRRSCPAHTGLRIQPTRLPGISSCSGPHSFAAGSVGLVTADMWSANTVTTLDVPSPKPIPPRSAIELHELVYDSGTLNFQGLRLPVSSNLKIPVWRATLSQYHDSKVADFLEFGWPVGYTAATLPRSTARNHTSATQCKVTQHDGNDPVYDWEGEGERIILSVTDDEPGDDTTVGGPGNGVDVGLAVGLSVAAVAVLVIIALLVVLIKKIRNRPSPTPVSGEDGHGSPGNGGIQMSQLPPSHQNGTITSGAQDEIVDSEDGPSGPATGEFGIEHEGPPTSPGDHAEPEEPSGGPVTEESSQDGTSEQPHTQPTQPSNGADGGSLPYLVIESTGAGRPTQPESTSGAPSTIWPDIYDIVESNLRSKYRSSLARALGLGETDISNIEEDYHLRAR